MSNQVTTPSCPDWCTEDHRLDSVFEEDLPLHEKTFGNYDNGTPGVVKVWVTYKSSKVEDCGIMVEYVEMTSPLDLRDLARDCLEAAEWMETTLEFKKA